MTKKGYKTKEISQETISYLVLIKISGNKIRTPEET
jgi:hypothetical protein